MFELGTAMSEQSFSLQCPVCHTALQKEAARYVCRNGHSFDRARSGYVNLLQRQSHRLRGDDSDMVRARRAFLEQGWYTPLLEAIEQAMLEYGTVSNPVILDIGCGEGWYSCHLARFLAAQGNRPVLAGFDISTNALSYAARRAGAEQTFENHWAVASINHLPAADQSADCLLNLFAPCEPKEFARVLRNNGILLRAIPLERHLWELKAAVYEQPYENRPVWETPEGFVSLAQEQIKTSITVSGDALRNLFDMTPYARKTAPADRAKLLAVPSLQVQLAFGLQVFRKA
ncbi:MAG: methyltransferase domain-containing protein [Oscillospiraceae bacterium]|nr:methyltransferase domain-containing protein [Oscillospiraceae bacterium]